MAAGGPPQGGSSGGASGGTAAAIAKLREATETLEKREEHLQRKIDNEVKQAKAFSAYPPRVRRK